VKPFGPGLIIAAVLPLSACGMMHRDRALASAGTDVAIGAAIGGVPGAVWADRNGDGRVDGYITAGRYFAGSPAGYDQGTYSATAGPATKP